MGRWVLLRHVLGDGTSHLDWMMERPGAAGLLSFRLAEGVDPRRGERFEAERIGEHRREYLEYEGPVSGDRGVLRRVADGECRVEVGEGEGLEMTWYFDLLRSVLVWNTYLHYLLGVSPFATA